MENWIAQRMGQAAVLAEAAACLSAGDERGAQDVCGARLARRSETIRFAVTRGSAPATGPVVPPASVITRIKIAVRDGFVDRYSPERWRLVNPGATRVISLRVGDAFLPTTMSAGTVRAYRGNAPVWWDCWPTVDHRLPRCHGGSNALSNLICVSWWRNDTKRSLKTEETGWTVQPPGDLDVWDGLSRWFLDAVADDPDLLEDSMVRTYHRSTTSAIH